jgi:hypothetical protein
MVEIPKFYTKREVVGNVTTWSISDKPVTGFAVHPAFIKDGVEVDKRYYSAYDACYFEASSGTYKSGLNLDALTVSTANDKLASVAGIYPIVGVTRATCRSLAANRGTGWRQLDFTLWSAVQLLYLTEYGTFNSQAVLGEGNVNGSYSGSSSDQNQSPHTIAGASNSLGNSSTNTTTGAGVDAKPGTSFMCYRGIENLYGNAWNWTDGVIGNPDGTVGTNAMQIWFTNNSADFSDTVRTNMTQITASATTNSAAYMRNIVSVDNFFVSSNVTGGSATTYLTDQWTGSTATDRVVNVGGRADFALAAGVFRVGGDNVAASRGRFLSARLAF